MIDLKQRVLAAAAAETSPTRSAVLRRRAVLAVAGALAALGGWLANGGVRPTGRPAALLALTSLGALAVAAVAVTLALRRGKSMLGRPAPMLIALALATPIVLLGWKSALSSAFPGMTVPWPDRPGLRCLCVALETGAAPLVALVAIWGGTQPRHPRLTGLMLGVAAGAVAWLLVDLWCPVGSVEHLVLGHVLPIAIFATCGALAGAILAVPRISPGTSLAFAASIPGGICNHVCPFANSISIAPRCRGCMQSGA